MSKLNKFHRAKAAFDAKDFETAIRLARDIFSSHTTENLHSASAHLLMLCYVSIRHYERAEYFFHCLEHIKRCDPVFLVNAAILYRFMKQYDKAKSLCEQALRVNSNYPDTYFVLGAIEHDLGNPTLALQSYNKGLAIEDRPAINTNIGNSLEELGLREEAKEAHLKTIASDPNQLEGWINLASIAIKERDYTYAETLYHNVIERDANNGGARMGLAHIQLMREQWADGWHNYRWRFIGDNRERTYPWPEADAIRDNKRLLIVFEQGYGDCFMAARYLSKFDPSLTMLNCPADMADIMGIIAPKLPVLTDMDSKKLIARFDCFIHIMDLFRLFQFNGCDQLLNYMSSNGSFNRDPVVGYCWRGRVKPDPRRTIDFYTFKPLVLPVIETKSLQLDATDKEKRNFTSGISLAHDWVMTMHEINKCNLIITIDSAIAHLAGAMGKHVWCLVPYSADWRYGLPSDALYRLSQFYPSMRIYQQNTENDWTGLIERVRSDLKRWLGLNDLERPPVPIGIRE